MKKKILLLVFFMPFFSGFSQNSLLWKIEKDGKTHFLYGIADFMRKDVFSFGDSVMIGLKAADFYVPQLELNEDNIRAISQAIFLPNGKTLRDTLLADDYLLLREKVTQVLKHDFSDYSGYQVFALSKAVAFARSAADSKVSLADHFQDIALKNRKEIFGLETVAQQLHFNSLLPIAAEMNFFRNLALSDSVQMNKLKAYKTQNIELYQKLHLGNDNWQAQRKAILTERNALILRKLTTIMGTGSVFATVETELLGGEFGLLALLRAANFRVTPVISATQTAARFVTAKEWIRSLDLDNFYISFPAKFETIENKIDSELGLLRSTSLNCFAPDGDPNIYYSITYTDYPKHLIHSDFSEMWEDIFNNSGDAVMEALEGELVEESSLSLSSYPGRETLAQFENGQKAVKFRSFLVQNRLYIVQVISLRDRINNSSVDKFLDSFQLK